MPLHGEGPDEALAYFRRLPRFMRQNTMRILDHEDAVRKVDPDHFEVLSVLSPGRRVRVVRQGDQWRCRVDKPNNEDRPCSHILAVLIYEGIVEIPNTAGTVWKKGNQKRNHTLETKAWEQVPVKLPQLLRLLLEQGLPAIQPPPSPPRRGRPAKPLYPLLYQAVMRVAWRQSLRCSRGAMQRVDNVAENPYGGCGIATLSRFLANPASTVVLEKFLSLSTWPAGPYETLVHPDGTGLTEQHFSDYFDKRYRRKKRRKKPVKEGEPEKIEQPRLHHWTYAEMLWTYRYTLIAAIHAQDGPFGEAPWLLPLLGRAALMFDFKELGGDKAYVSYDIFDYAVRHGMDPQIKFKENTNPTRSHARKKAFKRAYEESRIDPEGYAAKANRRNNAETGNHAFKAILGDQIYSKSAQAQRNEILCMCIAYNLTRLVFLEVEQGFRCDFLEGTDRLLTRPWTALLPGGPQVGPKA